MCRRDIWKRVDKVIVEVFDWVGEECAEFSKYRYVNPCGPIGWCFVAKDLEGL